jgi:hypothetical protein
MKRLSDKLTSFCSRTDIRIRTAPMITTQYQIGLNNYFEEINRTLGPLIMYEAKAYVEGLKNSYASSNLIDQMETQIFYSYALTTYYLKELLNKSSVGDSYISKKIVVKDAKLVSMKEARSMLIALRVGGAEDERYVDIIQRIRQITDLDKSRYIRELEFWLYFQKISEFMMLVAIEKLHTASDHLSSHVGMSIDDEFDSLIRTLNIVVSIVANDLNLLQSGSKKLNTETVLAGM